MEEDVELDKINSGASNGRNSFIRLWGVIVPAETFA
jgi:hypothetical protein